MEGQQRRHCGGRPGCQPRVDGDLELTVVLNEGITFSNGNPLTSDDVLYTLEHLRDSGRTASMVACVDFDKTICPDDKTIVIAMSTYDAGFL